MVSSVLGLKDAQRNLKVNHQVEIIISGGVEVRCSPKLEDGSVVLGARGAGSGKRAIRQTRTSPFGCIISFNVDFQLPAVLPFIVLKKEQPSTVAVLLIQRQSPDRSRL